MDNNQVIPIGNDIDHNLDPSLTPTCEVCGEKASGWIVDYVEDQSMLGIKMSRMDEKKHFFCIDHMRESKRIAIIPTSILLVGCENYFG